MAPSALAHFHVGHGSEVLAPKGEETPRQGGASLQTLRPLNPGLYFGRFILIFRREACNTWAHDPSLPVALGKPLILRAPGTCPHWTHVTRDYMDAREKVQN